MIEFIPLMATATFLLVMLLLGLLCAGGIYLARSGNQQLSSGRRGFLTGRNTESHAIFFALQIAIQTFGNDQLRAHLARLIAAEDDTDNAQEKRRFLKSVASLLLDNEYAWEYGFWDYQAEASTAISGFNQWRNEVEASMATEADEFGSALDRLQRFSDEKEFLVVTLMFLVDNRDEPVADDVGDYEFRATYQQLFDPFQAAVEGVGESQTWRHETFARLLEAVRALDPRVIERDAIYVYPGTAQDGLSSMDLLGEEGWKYLTDHNIRL